MEKVDFNYFYLMFLQKFQEYLFLNTKNKISIKDLEEESLFLLSNYYSSSKEKLMACDKSLYYVCTYYMTLSDSEIKVLPKDSFELLECILEELEKRNDSEYKNSFLFSLEFIYQKYLEILNVGSPILSSEENDNKEKFLKVTLDLKYKIMGFESVNMDLLEQVKIMNKLVVMEYNHQIGPQQKVKFLYRKDI